MRNIALAIAAGLAAFFLLYAPGLLKPGESTVPAVATVVVVYFLLARRSFKQVEAIFMEAGQYLSAMPPKFDLALKTMQRAYAIAPQQLGLRSQIDTQIGVMFFLQKDFKKAQELLQRSSGWGHWLGAAMLGVIHYKRKNHEAMHQTFAIALKKGKKNGLPWNLYAYLLCQIGERDRAQEILVEGLRRTGDDAKVKESLLALQNGKKIKMRSYKEQWYQFHLERPPQEMQQVPVGMRQSKAARRGRWS